MVDWQETLGPIIVIVVMAILLYAANRRAEWRHKKLIKGIDKWIRSMEEDGE